MVIGHAARKQMPESSPWPLGEFTLARWIGDYSARDAVR
jgi:hypothetical protein